MELDMALDSGIAEYVELLRAKGVETFESCEGGAGHVFPEPTVRFFGDQSEGYKAVAIALQHGLPVSSLRRYYDVINGELDGPRWEMTFATGESFMKRKGFFSYSGLKRLRSLFQKDATSAPQEQWVKDLMRSKPGGKCIIDPHCRDREDTAPEQQPKE